MSNDTILIISQSTLWQSYDTAYLCKHHVVVFMTLHYKLNIIYNNNMDRKRLSGMY